MSVTQGTWHTGEQIRDHKLACSIINFHNTPDAVFDDECLEELQAFTVNRSTTSRNKWLVERGLMDGPDGTRAETRAANEGSLAGLLVARYETDNPAFDEKDWDLLQNWFAKGMPEGEHVTRD